MKHNFFAFATLLCIWSLIPKAGIAQNMMKLNDSLKANSSPLSVKTRGGSILKFDFDVYKTLSAKAGLIKTTSTRYSTIENSASKQKASIVLLGNESDTATINISNIITAEEVRDNAISIFGGKLTFGKDEAMSGFKQSSNLIAIITTNRDTSTWNFIYSTMLNSGDTKENNNFGLITNGSKQITINTVTVWNNGKSPAFYPSVGYEFYIDGIAVAALQHPMDTFQKKFVWLKNTLDKNIKLILASAAAILLSFTNQLPN